MKTLSKKASTAKVLATLAVVNKDTSGKRYILEERKRLLRELIKSLKSR